MSNSLLDSELMMTRHIVLHCRRLMGLPFNQDCLPAELDAEYQQILGTEEQQNEMTEWVARILPIGPLTEDEVLRMLLDEYTLWALAQIPEESKRWRCINAAHDQVQFYAYLLRHWWSRLGEEEFKSRRDELRARVLPQFDLKDFWGAP